MTLRECALEIEPSATPERIHNIEQILRRWAADELSLAAIAIDDADRNDDIQFPTEASAVCRRLAAAHLAQT